MYFRISSVSSYSMSLIFCKNVLSTCINKMLEPEFLLTRCGLHNSCRSRFCSSFGRVVTEKVTAREVGWIWMSPTLLSVSPPGGRHSLLHIMRPKACVIIVRGLKVVLQFFLEEKIKQTHSEEYYDKGHYFFSTIIRRSELSGLSLPKGGLYREAISMLALMTQ